MMEEHEFYSMQQSDEKHPSCWTCKKCGEEFWSWACNLEWGKFLCGECLEAQEAGVKHDPA